MTTATEATDRVLFRTACDVGAGQRIYGWDGPWPPPERMVIVTGPSGSSAVCNPAEHATALGEVAQMDGWQIEHFQLHHASEIDRPASADEFWFRGAEYIPADVSP